MNIVVPNSLAESIDKKLRAKENAKKAGAFYVLNNDLKAILNLGRLPARLSTPLTAACLGFKVHDIPILTARGFLKPLGNPVPNCDKYYSRSRVLELADDEEWLSQATAELSQHWQDKNARKTKKPNGRVRPVEK